MAQREQQSEDALSAKIRTDTGWTEIQKKTFTRWCNQHLKKVGVQIDDLYKDLADGLVLIRLLEVLSRKDLGRHNAKPRIAVARIENLSIALKFLAAENVHLVNIGAEDIHDGNQRIILGLIWTLILRYQINVGGEEDSGKNAKDELLEWVRSKIGPKTPYNYDVQNFTKDWNDGRTLAALIDALQPGAYPNHRELPVGDRKKHDRNCDDGINRAFEYWEVPKLLDGDDLADPKVDQQSVMTYISQFRNLDPKVFTRDIGPPPKQPGDDARNTRAYGPGLAREGLLEQRPAEFKVEAPKDTTEKLEVRVLGPDGESLPADLVKVVPRSQGNWEVEYTPSEPGDYKILVLLGGFHVPGSVFTVTIGKDDSIGGKGKVVCFFSTTSSTQKGRDDFQNLSALFKKKEIHLREDFTPWVPVDVMGREDREAVFRMAGTRALPILFVDDKYVGDYDRCAALEKSGELDKLLAYKGARSGKRAAK